MANTYVKLPPSGSGSGTVTEVDTGAGLTGGPITTTGTVSLTAPVTVALGGTNSTTSLTNDLVVKSHAGKIVESGVTIDTSNNVGGIGTADTSGRVNVTIANNTPAFVISNIGGGVMNIQSFAGVRLELVTSGPFFQFADNGDGNAAVLARATKNLLLACDGTSAAKGVVVQGSSGQTALLLDVQLNDTTSIFSVAVGGNTTVNTTTGAFSPPRMTTTQRDAISGPTKGMMIYNTSTDKFQGYNGTWGDLPA